jgi:hypothetical protein
VKQRACCVAHCVGHCPASHFYKVGSHKISLFFRYIVYIIHARMKCLHVVYPPLFKRIQKHQLCGGKKLLVNAESNLFKFSLFSTTAWKIRKLYQLIVYFLKYLTMNKWKSQIFSHVGNSFKTNIPIPVFFLGVFARCQ